MINKDETPNLLGIQSLYNLTKTLMHPWRNQDKDQNGSSPLWRMWTFFFFLGANKPRILLKQSNGSILPPDKEDTNHNK